MDTDSIPLSEAFILIAELADALGISDLAAQPGPWVCEVDDNWTLGVNAGTDKVRIEQVHLPVPPFHAGIARGGFPVGLISPYGGTMLADENIFIDALRARILLETGQPAVTRDARKEA